METLRGRCAVVTGASGGIGREIALALAREGMDVVVSGRRVEALEAVAGELRALDVRAEAVPADLGDLSQASGFIARCEAALAPVGVLVNNAGIELSAAFTECTPQELTAMVDVNLTAPMLLTRSVVPGMLARGYGHVVFISSVAGKIGPAYQQSYAATKAGLIGLNQSLRAEYLSSPVGFSVVCPGFTAGDGMYQRMAEAGYTSNRLMGTTTTQKVAAKVVDAIRRDRPEVIETGAPIRPAIIAGQIAPRTIERLAPRFGITELFRRAAAGNGRAG